MPAVGALHQEHRVHPGRRVSASIARADLGQHSGHSRAWLGLEKTITERNLPGNFPSCGFITFFIVELSGELLKRSCPTYTPYQEVETQASLFLDPGNERRTTFHLEQSVRGSGPPCRTQRSGEGVSSHVCPRSCPLGRMGNKGPSSRRPTRPRTPGTKGKRASLKSAEAAGGAVQGPGSGSGGCLQGLSPVTVLSD